MNHENPRLVLFVGFRKGALKAARKMNLKVGLLLHDSSPLPLSSDLAQIEFVEKIDLSLSPDTPLVEEVKEKLLLVVKEKGFPLAGLAALTERGVVWAAHLRKAMGNLKGISPEVAWTCHDKWIMKQKASLHAVPITPCCPLEGPLDPQALVEKLGLPLVIKERCQSGGRNTKICHDLSSVKEHLQEGLLAERFVFGQEMSIESFIQNNKVVFRNLTHYYLPLSINILPAKVLEEIYCQAIELNDRVIKNFGIERGMTHMEVYLTKDGPLFGEIALRPPGGYIMDLLGLAYGIDPWQTLLQIELGEELEEQDLLVLKNSAPRFAASWVIHPGPGIVEKVEGLEEIKKFKEIVLCKIKLRPGQKILPRQGAGEDKGRILFRGEHYEELVESLEKARQRLTITMKKEETVP